MTFFLFFFFTFSFLQHPCSMFSSQHTFPSFFLSRCLLFLSSPSTPLFFSVSSISQYQWRIQPVSVTRRPDGLISCFNGASDMTPAYLEDFSVTNSWRIPFSSDLCWWKWHIQVCPPGMLSEQFGWQDRGWRCGRGSRGRKAGCAVCVCVCVYVCVCVWVVEIDGIRGKEGLAVSQLDLLILQPWGKGVCACVCVDCICLVEICQF